MTTDQHPSAATDAVQRTLRAAVGERLRRARPELAARHDLSTTAGLKAAGAAATAADDVDDTLVAVVVRDLDLVAWARQTCAYTLGLGAAEAAAWRRAFTRTVFLAGNPEQLGVRFPLARLAPDRSAAWTAPGPPAATAALRRLLKLLQAPAEVLTGQDTAFEIPRPASSDAPAVRRPPATRDLYLATVDCTLSSALVHLNHLLAEAVLDNLLAPGDRLVLRRVPRLVAHQDRFAAVRVVPDEHAPDRLRLAAALTEPLAPGPD
ncbi:DUF6182 family protein [Streptomyces sp. 3214.6]|uniref:DUF6182 family protein n=1 Tax=Streptomyces sp. 3214.6 TaxID=1882757 RepID=UPI0009098198|nr:DUF6182 family protein [Streptomyces sp. 3214.6]SHH50627.1 hypothetical protein SAMN05444521_0752 [Streptomyces sp. 3214.6]